MEQKMYGYIYRYIFFHQNKRLFSSPKDFFFFTAFAQRAAPLVCRQLYCVGALWFQSDITAGEKSQNRTFTQKSLSVYLQGVQHKANTDQCSETNFCFHTALHQFIGVQTVLPMPFNKSLVFWFVFFLVFFIFSSWDFEKKKKKIPNDQDCL